MKKLKVFTLCALSAALISSCGDDDSRTLNAADNRAGSVSVAASATTLIEGVEMTASVSDDDGITSEIRYQWNANGFPITGATSALYVVSNTYAGATISVSAVYSDDAGFTETLISASSTEIVPLTSFGVLSAATTNDVADLTGSVGLVGDNVTVTAADATTSYGTFTIDANGDWVYSLNTSDATIAGLDSSSSVNDEIVVEASDGTVGLLVIVITGAEVVEVPNKQAAVIRDTESSDTGELRYEFDAPMLAGKLVASFNKADNAVATSDGNAKDAYITFYGDSGSTSGGKAIADLRIHAADFELRDQDFVISNPFTPGQWQDVEITWEAANEVTPPMVTVTIDGVSVTAEAFSSPDAAVGGVASIAFRFADNSAILPDDITYKVDDIEIYSDAAGTTLVFEDDFESYDEGTDLDFDNNANSPYNKSSFLAVVEAISGATDGPVAGDNQFAAITDTDSSDSGELRYRFESPMLAGKLVAAFNKPANAIEINDELAAKDAYITLFNSAHSTSSGRAIADIRIQTDQFVLRDQDDIVVSNPFTPGQWQNVEITWEAANDVTPPMVTVTIDGVSVTTEAFSSPDGAIGGVSAIAFRFADNTAIVPEDISFKVDDILVYSDVAGTTLVHEDDFESYSDGTDLDPDNNGNSVYNSSTFQAVVASNSNSADGGSEGGTDGGTGGSTEGNQIAAITDTDSSDSGELRYRFESPMLAGKLVAAFNKPANAIEINDELAAKDAYITLFNSAHSTSSGRAIADIRIQTDQFVLRDQDDIVVSNPFTPGQWQNVEITWEAANDVTPPMVTVTIDGVSVTTEAFSSPDGAIGGVSAIAFRFADNTAIVPEDISFKVDDISIYSDVSGTALVFEDDFESYGDGTDLDPDNNGNSVYNSSTFQAVVATEQ